MDRSKLNKSIWRSVWPQWLAAFEVFLQSINYAVLLGFLAPFMGKLVRPNPPFSATKAQITWVASLLGVSKPIGVILATVSLPWLGSKRTMYICGIYFLIGWIFLISANIIELCYVTIICAGIGIGMYHVCFPIYIGEIATNHNRGTLISFVVNGLMIGLVMGNLMGGNFEPWIVAAISLVWSIFYFISFYFFPQTPHQLIARKKIAEAGKAIEWYNRGIDVTKELTSLSRLIEANPPLPFLSSLKTLFTVPVHRKTLIKFGLFCFFIELSGVFVLLEYMEIIFMHAKVTVASPSTMVSVVNFMAIPSSWVSMYTIDKTHRLPLILTTCVVLTTTICSAGFSYQLLDMGYTNPNIQWLAIISLVIYRMSMAIGLAPVIMTIMSEVFAPSVKCVGTGICIMMSSLGTFLAHKYFLYWIDLITIKYVFYLFGVFIIICGIYAKFYVPETSGKTLQEIQASVCGKRIQEISEETYPAVEIKLISTNPEKKLNVGGPLLEIQSILRKKN